MITSHAHQLVVNTSMTSSAHAEPFTASAESAPHSGGPGSESPAQFEDDFDIPPIHLPPSALEEPDYNNGAYHQQQQHYHHHHQQQQTQQQHQQHMYQQQQQQQQYQQQQQWSNNHCYNGYQQYNEYNNGSNFGYNMHYQQPPQPMGVAMGGPSPGSASHNTPSPTGHSEDGDQEVRNNNVLKQNHPWNAGHPPGGGAAGQPPPVTGGGGGGPHPAAHPQAPGVPFGHQYGGPPVHHHPGMHHHNHMNVMPVKPKPKVSKRKKKRDPNEPQKPVSAYALFFRDSQASIKQANPNAAFGDVSKIVASMWDNLDPEAKANYKKRTENAKKDYLKKLAAYRASLVSKGSGDIGYGYSPYTGYPHHHHHGAAGADMKGHFMQSNTSPTNSPGSNYMGQPIPPRPPMQQAPPGGNMTSVGHHQHHMHHQQPHGVSSGGAATAAGGGYMMHGQQGQMQNGMVPQQQHQQPPMHHMHPPQASPLDSQGGHSPTSSNTSQTPQTTPTSTTSGHTPNGAAGGGPGGVSGGPLGNTGNNSRDVPKICGRPGCNNPVQRNAEGQSDFCSSECVVGQCREVYSSWTSNSYQQMGGGQPGGGGGQGQGPPQPQHGGGQHPSAPHHQPGVVPQHQGVYNNAPQPAQPPVQAATAAVK